MEVVKGPDPLPPPPLPLLEQGQEQEEEQEDKSMAMERLGWPLPLATDFSGVPAAECVLGQRKADRSLSRYAISFLPKFSTRSRITWHKEKVLIIVADGR